MEEHNYSTEEDDFDESSSDYDAAILKCFKNYYLKT